MYLSVCGYFCLVVLLCALLSVFMGTSVCTCLSVHGYSTAVCTCVSVHGYFSMYLCQCPWVLQCVLVSVSRGTVLQCVLVSVFMGTSVFVSVFMGTAVCTYYF